jgi:ABC-type xylose transport system permease subunit
MGSGEERYKIVVHLTVFQSKATGLYIASRCLWNTHTDNSVTLRMYGVDCDILIVVFLCYTDLGAI